MHSLKLNLEVLRKKQKEFNQKMDEYIRNLENLFKTDKYLANVMVYGDRKPYLTALLVRNFENIEKYANYKKIDFLNHCDLVRHPRVLDLVRRRIDRLQEDLPS